MRHNWSTPLFKQNDLPKGYFDSSNELNQLSPTSPLIRRWSTWTLKDWFVKFSPLTQRWDMIVNCPSQKKNWKCISFWRHCWVLRIALRAETLSNKWEGMRWNGVDVKLWIDRCRIYQAMTTCLSHGILFCILLASPIQRLYYELLAASNANFHDAVNIPVTLFAIFYHSPQEPLLS